MRRVDDMTGRFVDLWRFKSTKSNKWYIVEVEEFPHNFHGIKFYYKGVAASKRRYSLLTHDYEPRKVVMSCVKIMHHYFARDARASFGFVAADDTEGSRYKVFPNKRFRLYRRIMLTMFSPGTFVQAADVEHSVYLLINSKLLHSGELSLSAISDALSTYYVGAFSVEVGD